MDRHYLRCDGVLLVSKRTVKDYNLCGVSEMVHIRRFDQKGAPAVYHHLFTAEGGEYVFASQHSFR